MRRRSPASELSGHRTGARRWGNAVVPPRSTVYAWALGGRVYLRSSDFPPSPRMRCRKACIDLTLPYPHEDTPRLYIVLQPSSAIPLCRTPLPVSVYIPVSHRPTGQDSQWRFSHPEPQRSPHIAVALDGSHHRSPALATRLPPFVSQARPAPEPESWPPRCHLARRWYLARRWHLAGARSSARCHSGRGLQGRRIRDPVRDDTNAWATPPR